MPDHASEPAAKIKVLVVDDSRFMRKVIADILNDDPGIEVTGEAENGVEALSLIEKLRPDVITLDLVMPVLNGFGTLAQIIEQPHPPAVVMLSAYTENDTEVTLNCLSLGAVDFILKPSESNAKDLKKISVEIRTKVKTAASATPKQLVYAGPRMPEAAPTKPYAALVIGSSTGGPVALEHVLPQLPHNLPYPVLVAQHMPDQFVSTLAARLAKTAALEVRILADGEVLGPGAIYFARGGADTEVFRVGGQVVAKSTPSDNILTPSVDKLMTSAAQAYGAGTLGVILTGMGEDGLAGMKAIKQAGGATFVQDEQSSVVFGMGRAVVEHGLADEVLPLDQIVKKISSS